VTKMNEATSRWAIPSKVLVSVKVDAANVICALRHVNVCDVSCIAHTLQLVPHDSIYSQTSVEAAVVKKARKVVTHFKHSEQPCRYLKACQASREV